MTQQDLLLAQAEAVKAGRDHALITIIAAEGSTPRSSGKMLVFADGECLGTIGGGRVERLAAQDAQKAMRNGGNLRRAYALTEEQEGIGMACGGSVEVFIETFAARPQLIMCGAGHVGGALIRLAQFCGFEVTLLDTRDEAYIRDKIELADRFVHAENFRDGLLSLPLRPGACIVIATFGHAGDGEALDAALQKEAAYVGMIGSRSKVQNVFASMAARGHSRAAVEKVYTPIGLDIGSETPEEIALAVMAEVMMVKKGGSGKPLRDC